MHTSKCRKQERFLSLTSQCHQANTPCDMLEGLSGRDAGGVVRKLGVLTPLRGCRKLAEYDSLKIQDGNLSEICTLSIG